MRNSVYDKDDERAREDHYITPYQGKVYPGVKRGALEVATIAMQYTLDGDIDQFKRFISYDREMVDLVAGVLFHYAP